MSKLMLVEDDNNLREIYEARLQAEGYDIVSAKDGEEGLAVAKAEKPDLVISDVMMPKISGFEMLDILRNTDGLKNVKVIMLTALGQSDDQQRADKLGADRYLVKSQVTLEDIVRAAHELLEDEPEEEAPAPEEVSVAPPPAPVEPVPVAPLPVPEPAVPPVAPPVVAPAPIPDPTPVTPVATAAPVAAPPEPATEVPVIQMPPAPVQPPNTAPTPETIQDTNNALLEEPVALPEPAPAIPTPPVLESSPLDSSTEAVTTSDEAAEVDDQIENFVTGATTNADTPTAEFTTAQQVDAPAAPLDDNVSQADDSLVTSAIDSLAGQQTPVSTPPVVDEPEPEAPNVVISGQTAATAPPAEPDIDTQPEKPKNDNVTIAHKKIITPPSQDTSKPDIQTLFALEQAKEAAGASPPEPKIVVSNSTPLNPNDGSQPPDPNSIAL
jgi:CheY-like chemotaxis protein